MRPILLALLLAGSPTAPRAAPGLPPVPGDGDVEATLFHGGRVRVGDGGGAPAEALLVRGGRVVAIGGEAELAARAAGAPVRRIDLGGGTAVPGLQDAHVRLDRLACAPYFVDLSGCADLTAVLQRLAAAAASAPEGEWIEARGLQRAMLPEGELPTHEPLSEAFPDNPVLVRSADGEAAWVNAEVLRKARIVYGRHGFPHVDGGRVVKGADGRPSGLLLGRAVELLEELVPPSHRDALSPCLLHAHELLLARGVTCVHVMGADRALLEELVRLREKGLWKLRVAAWLDGTASIDRRLARELSPARPGGDALAVVGIHLRVDGAIAWGGEALLESTHGDTRRGAELRTSTDVLADRLRSAARLGLSPALEAHGDRGARIALDLLQSVGLVEHGLRELRPRVEGADLVTPRDWERFPELGVVVSIQPARAGREVERLAERLGKERTRAARVWWALAPELGGYALGSGWPATDGDLLRAMALARRAHGEAGGDAAEGPGPGAARALAGFTRRAAEAAHQEATRGLLAPGFAADLTVLDVDPLECRPEELERARVLMTVIDGEVVFAAGE